MIEELRIQNFQAHAKLRVVFGPGITTIVGPSDAGKSAILRALRWAATNQPGGDAFVRHGTPGCTVALMVDGRTVTRKRKAGGEVNTYHLDDAEYKAFGRGVPDTIEAFLNLPPVCWQGQHDASFWFGETAGEVSRQLNAIVDLGVIDTTMANVARTFNKARTRLEVAEEEVAEAKKEVERTAWAAGCDAALAVVERAYGDADAAAGRARWCRGTYEAAITQEAAVKRAQGRAGAATALCDAAGAALDAAQRAQQCRLVVLGAAANQTCAKHAHGRADAAAALCAAGGVAYDASRRHERLLKAVKTAIAARALAAVRVPEFRPVHDTAKSAVITARRAGELRRLFNRITQLQETLCQKEREMKRAAKAVPNTCPMCGQSFAPTST